VNQRRSSFVVVSAAIHGALILAVLAASVFAPGPPVFAPGLWQSMLAYHQPDRLVRVEDINLPAPKQSRTAAKGNAGPTNAAIPAPVQAPDGVRPETGREDAVVRAPGILTTIEQGSDSVDVVGTTETPLPPPAVVRPPVRLHSGIDPPRKIVDASPVYPALARQSRVEGMVILEVVIDDNGAVTSTRVLRSVPLLDQAATEAVQRWRFAPARLNGDAIPIVMTVTINFTLKP
jgi:TonB family protein